MLSRLAQGLRRTAVANTRAYADRYFTKSHEWIEVDGTTGTVGVTDYAQSALGEVVFVELPSVGSKYSKEGNLASIESVKASAVVYAPVSGSVVEVNDAVTQDHSLINKAAESKGWLAKLKLSDPSELKSLLNKAQYEKLLKEEGH